LVDKDAMPNDLSRILRLEVPLVVQIAERKMSVLVNNTQIGSGRAVKVGENFGVRLTRIGEVKDRVVAMGGN